MYSFFDNGTQILCTDNHTIWQILWRNNWSPTWPRVLDQLFLPYFLLITVFHTYRFFVMEFLKSRMYVFNALSLSKLTWNYFTDPVMFVAAMNRPINHLQSVVSCETDTKVICKSYKMRNLRYLKGKCRTVNAGLLVSPIYGQHQAATLKRRFPVVLFEWKRKLWN